MAGSLTALNLILPDARARIATPPAARSQLLHSMPRGGRPLSAREISSAWHFATWTRKLKLPSLSPTVSPTDRLPITSPLSCPQSCAGAASAPRALSRNHIFLRGGESTCASFMRQRSTVSPQGIAEGYRPSNGAAATPSGRIRAPPQLLLAPSPHPPAPLSLSLSFI